MSFWCWVVFMLADIDKTTAMSMEFWFPVLNISNDGCLSVEDLRELYKDNLIHLIAGTVCSSFTNVLKTDLFLIQATAM